MMNSFDPDNTNDSDSAFQHRLGTCRDSLCLPGRIVLGRMSDSQTLGVRLQNLVLSLFAPANHTSTFELTIHHLLKHASLSGI